MLNKFAALILILLMIAAGCSSVGKINKDNAEDQYATAKKLYDEGKYYHAAEAFRLMIFNFSGVSYIDSVQYYLGMCYFSDEDYILAVSEFKRLARNFPYSPLADDAQLKVGECYYMNAPDNVGLDQTDTYAAISELENFIEDYPNSSLLQEATGLLDKCRARIAQKTYKNGEQYYKMGNYRSARIYLERVVTDFTSEEWRGCALYKLAEIDAKEEKYEDAAAKLSNLITTFPGHKWEEDAQELLQEVQTKAGDSLSEVADD